MEPDFEKNIRLKVYEAEQYPVRWGKEELWARMEINRSTRSRRTVYFSIAASLMIAILAGIYTHQRTTAIPDKTIANENPVHLQPTEEVQQPSTSKNIPLNIEQDIAPKVISQNNARIRIEEEPYISALPATTSDSANIPEASTEIEVATAIHENINDEASQENDVKRPKVIIGIIPQQEQPLLTQQEKKKRFRFLKGKSSDGEPDGSQLIIARIN